MRFNRTLQGLCTPAYIYFVVSAIAFIICAFCNWKNRNKYVVGTLELPVTDNVMIFVAKAVYIVFWTWILNLMCKDGHSSIAWMLILFPFILFAVVFATGLMIHKKNVDTFRTQSQNKRRTTII